MDSNLIIFYISSFLIIIFVFGTLFSKNLVYSLLCAISVFLLVSIIFYILGSEYNAIIQALVYGIAVPVIIGVSIMFTSGKKKDKKSNFLPFLAVVISIIFLLLFADSVFISAVKTPNCFNFTDIEPFNSFDVISAFARGIFIDYVWAFELLSLLLTIVIAGLTLFNGRERCNKPKIENSKLKVNNEEVNNV